MEQKGMSYLGAYEFMPGSSTETESEQFLVVENNGTFLLNMDKDVQYVTEIQDVKQVLESVQSCAVYDTATQQYYVDVDNASELLSVSDTFIIPNTDNSAAYTDANNYLLQSIPEESIEIPNGEPDASNEEYSELVIRDTSVNMVQVPESTLTEVTLNDGQWKMLEQKGWVLLEFNDRTFLLDTLGLHDITDNQNLVEQFKDEIAAVLQNESANADTSCNQMPQTSLPEVPSVSEEIKKDTEKIEMPMPILKIECKELAVSPKPKLAPRSLLKRPSGTLSLLKPIRKPKPLVQKVTKPKPRRVGGLLRFETPLKMEEIPQTIVLGKTAAGKNLVAKVTAVKTNSVLAIEKSQEPTKDDDPEMDKLYRLFVTVGSQLTCEAKDITKAQYIIRQLLAVPATRSSLVGSYLLVTMVKTETDKKDTKPPVMVTGRVANVNGDWVFVYVPHMLQKMMEDCTEEEYIMPGPRPVRCARARAAVLHVHVASAARANTNITFAKKLLPLQAISKKLPSLHACASCAKCFDSETEVIQHQEDCVGESMTPDSESIDDPVDTKDNVILKDSKNNTKVCPICKANVKLKNYKKHQGCHFATTDKSTNMLKAQFQCKMCPSMYFYASSLSKHIMKTHIGEKIK